MFRIKLGPHAVAANAGQKIKVIGTLAISRDLLWLLVSIKNGHDSLDLPLKNPRRNVD
jgi:hypothetical protein